LLFLLVGSVIISVSWSENTGDAKIELANTLTNAAIRLKQDSKIAYLGLIQSFFEGAMYVFVFMWTPALESTSHLPIYHGWVFASFMICVLIGSVIFKWLLERGIRVEKSAMYVFAIAAVSIAIPANIANHTFRFLAFCVFEVCVGMFWPSLGFMRSRYVPEEVRATVMNMFRIPLNFIVCIVLYHISSLSEFSVFMICCLCLVITFLCQVRFLAITENQTNKKYQPVSSDDIDIESKIELSEPA